jgi:WXXGXW repeat (2 copies)
MQEPSGLPRVPVINQKDGHMSKPMEIVSTLRTVRSGLALLLTGATLLAGCVAEVRPAYSPPPPPPAYSPPPPAAEYESSAPAPELQMQATQPPPPLPEYQQPPCPEVGYLWTPGYWAFSTAGYYWIPGTWVSPPTVGVLWTPGYWGFVGGVYAFHTGYWGPHIGFYGGVNYGFGYGGVGFAGGRWVGNAYHYNTAVTNVNTTVIHNTYVNNVTVNNVTVNKVSYNGPGGVAAQPTPAERQAAAETHTPPTPAQVSHVHEAVSNPQLAAKANGGHPAIAATARPGSFTKESIVPAKGAPPLKPIVPAKPIAPAAHATPTNPASHEPVNAAHPESAPPKAPAESFKQPTPAVKPPVSNAVHAPATQPPGARPPAATTRPAPKTPPPAKKPPPPHKEGEKP